MSSNICEKILYIDKKRKKLLSKLLSIEKMMQGSFCLIHVKCGSKKCRCNAGELHPHQRLSFRRRKHQYSRAIPKEDRKWVKEMTENFRTFRQIRKEIKDLDHELMELLNQYEENMVFETSKEKAYLDV